MKLGIVARCDNRGIAYQSYEAVRGLKPERVLVVLMKDRRWPEEPGRFTSTKQCKVIFADSDMNTRLLEVDRMRKFLTGLDAVLSIETVYDWRMIELADELGVRVVVQGNPEFYTHHQDPLRPQPHEWVWPTTWMQGADDIPDGPLLPVPAPAVENTATHWSANTLRILHVAGHRALGDRNGTDLVFEALPLIGEKVHFTIVGQDGALPSAARLGKHVTVETNPKGVKDRWDLYRNQHIVLLPRRYGGLSLPAIEACSRGVIPMMPDVDENQLWPIMPLVARSGRLQRVPYGHVPTWLARPNHIAYEIDKIARNRDRLMEHQNRVLDWADDNSWKSWEPQYRDVLAG